MKIQTRAALGPAAFLFDCLCLPAPANASDYYRHVIFGNDAITGK